MDALQTGCVHINIMVRRTNQLNGVPQPVSPAKPILQRILATAAFAGNTIGNMVFFDQFVLFQIELIHRLQPASRDFITQKVIAIHFKSLNCHPL
ncbi:Uncharacterised protein [Escherichia coli]|uniref:Uncharacterized protein n=1 Tax=Escherichia coli TaxID=562 RepID=A0A376NXA8_ECOLX|nr:Uncharacterised protein [Escherichia coli]